MEHESWIRIERVHHQHDIVDSPHRYGRILLVRRGEQVIYRHKLDLFELFAKRQPIVWGEWKPEFEIY